MQPAKLRRPAAALWLTLLLIAASALTSQAFAAPSTVVTDSDKGRTVQLNAGAALELRLKSNPSTGYAWSLDPKSTPLLKLTSQTTTKPTQPGVGRPIYQVFEFQAVRAGSGILLLRYARSWQKPSDSDEQFDLHVTIR